MSVLDKQNEDDSSSFCQFQICPEETDDDEEVLLAEVGERPDSRGLRESSAESAATALMTMGLASGSSSPALSSSYGRGSAQEAKAAAATTTVAGRRQIPRPTSIFAHPGSSLPSRDPGPPTTACEGRGKILSGLIRDRSRKVAVQGKSGVVPQIRCSSHFHGASAPSTPSNGHQHLPGWMVMQGADAAEVGRTASPQQGKTGRQVLCTY